MRYITIFTLLCLLITFQFLPAQAPDTLWTKTFGVGFGNCVIETSDSGYVLVGEKEEDVYLLKTNSVGDSLWSKTYGDQADETGCTVRQISGDRFIITGTRYINMEGWEDVLLL
jgi:hypothetical protein